MQQMEEQKSFPQFESLEPTHWIKAILSGIVPSEGRRR
jgi:hypothetical protein